MEWMRDNTSGLSVYAAILAVVFVTLTASIANCESEERGEDEIVTLEAGQVAPFAGDLYAVAASLRFAFSVDNCNERADAKITHAARLFEAELAGTRKGAAIRTEADARRIALLSERLGAAEAWYRSPVLWAVVGGLVVIGSGAVMAYVGGQLAVQ